MFALGGAVGVGGKPGDENDGFVEVGFFGGVAAGGFFPMRQVVLVALFAAGFAALPLRVFLDEFVKFAVGNGGFVEFERADFGQGGVGGEVEGAVGAAGQFGHAGGGRGGGDYGQQAV